MKRVTAFLLMFILLFGGCAERASDMFAMPELPKTQRQLIDIVGTVLERGYDYSELRSGINREPLQLVDLDGDGTEEGIACLRASSDGYKTFIYIFKANDTGFRLYDIIESPANDLLAVSYIDVIGQNGIEIVAEWDSGDPENRNVQVYDLGETGVELVLDVSAINYAITDLDGDEDKEFVAIASRDKRVYADVYTSQDMTKAAKEIPLSQGGGEILGVKSGSLMKDGNGVFIERKTEYGKVVDIIMHNGESFVNVFPEGEKYFSGAVCEDVNGDGIIDIPEEPFDTYFENVANGCYRWSNISKEGTSRVVAFTHHSFAENWYLLLPVSWAGSVYATRTFEKSGCIKIHFSTREKLDGDTESFFEAPLFTLYVFTGENRKRNASENGGFTVGEHENMIFKAKITSVRYLGTEINEAFIRSALKKRQSEWLLEIPVV